MNDEINLKLVEYMENHRFKAIEPRIDSVWGFVPGLEGQKLIMSCHNNMLLNGDFDLFVDCL